MNAEIKPLVELLERVIEHEMGLSDDACDLIRAAITKARAPIANNRWRCPCCKSLNVQISLPTWYYETTSHDLERIEVDEGADISWWYCEDCGETDGGNPEDVLDDEVEEVANG